MSGSTHPPEVSQRGVATDTANNRQSPGEEDDNDSAFGDEDATSTTSLKSEDITYCFEHGRRYHDDKEINYVLPNDDTEQERLRIQHALFLLALEDKLFQCPAGKVEPIGRCLDAGTGTGDWAMAFADDHPDCEVIGIDISPIQPSFVPPNLSFQIDNLKDPWTFKDSYFDFVFARMLMGHIGNCPQFYSQSYKKLTPGGWIEVQDIGFPVQCDDDSVSKNSYLWQWSDNMMKATKSLGRNARSAARCKSQLLDAGFVRVTEKIYKWPMNHWPADPKQKELGSLCHQNIAEHLSGLSMALFTRGLGWTESKVEAFLVGVRNDMKSMKIHAWWPIYVVYGQKPE